jgi:regulator of sirC expression with transglutaminase-like and TPR domain
VRRGPELIAFSHFVKRLEDSPVDGPDPGIDLGQAALMVAEAFEPGLDIAWYASRLERIGDEARRRIAGTPEGDAGAEARARRILRLLYEEIGFAGNRDAYYDPRNSFLNHVLDRRLGIPITLAVVLIEVSRHAGVPAEGVGFPGHFLAQLPGPDGPLLIDPFTGQVLTPDALRALHARIGGGDGDLDPRHLAPVGKKQILVRMLGNLRAIYSARSDDARLRVALERLEVMQPDNVEVARALESLGPPPAPEPGGSGKLPN